jgi:hypothetical protein
MGGSYVAVQLDRRDEGATTVLLSRNHAAANTLIQRCATDAQMRAASVISNRRCGRDSEMIAIDASMSVWVRTELVVFIGVY